MALNLFYITNDPRVAVIADKYGVDRVWIDLETLGKEERQKNINSVKSHHKISDITQIKPLLKRSEMLVRVNPWNEDSEDEINAVIRAGADVIMLPMWKNTAEVRKFLDTVGGRVKTTLLLETKEACECVDEVLGLDFDEIHIGLNDLHLSYGLTFMFELLVNGTVEALCEKFRKKSIPYGFGGIAALGSGMLPAERIILEHYRLGSTRAILSRSFCNCSEITDINEIEKVISTNLAAIREYEKYCATADRNTFEENRRRLIENVGDLVRIIREKKNEK